MIAPPFTRRDMLNIDPNLDAERAKVLGYPLSKK
jgi:hypothetical protein